MSIRILNTLTDSAYQSVSFVTEESEDVTLSLTVRGLALTSFVNILDPYSNNMTWSLYVWSEDGFDPWRSDDFTTGRIR